MEEHKKLGCSGSFLFPGGKRAKEWGEPCTLSVLSLNHGIMKTV
jgi:hypothetical protein